MAEDFTIEGFEEEVVVPVDDTQPVLGNLDVYADIVYCIDLTGSMHPIIQKVKETASTLHADLQRVMQENYHRTIKQLRIKIIGFRDFYCDGSFALEKSEFFYLPEEEAEFKEFVNKLEAKGGGDIPENSLEALALAMQSDWCTTIDESIRKRHIIVLFTDASAHPLEKGVDCTNPIYPENMPKSYSELLDWWSGQGSLENGTAVEMNQTAKRFALFAPEGSEPWTDISDDFDGCLTTFIEPDKGGIDITTKNLLKTLGETMAGG